MVRFCIYSCSFFAGGAQIHSGTPKLVSYCVHLLAMVILYWLWFVLSKAEFVLIRVLIRVVDIVHADVDAAC